MDCDIADWGYIQHLEYDNNSGEACENSGGAVFRPAMGTDTAEEGTCYASKGAQSFISDTSLYNVALMTRSNAYVSAAGARNADASPSHKP